jgi:hypothetical protein
MRQAALRQLEREKKRTKTKNKTTLKENNKQTNNHPNRPILQTNPNTPKPTREININNNTTSSTCINKLNINNTI